VFVDSLMVEGTGSEANVGYTQQELNEQWRILKERPVNEYAEARITEDTDTVQGLQFDVVETLTSSGDVGKTISFTRRRESPNAEWGLWEEGRNVSVPF
jgi:hypothetical protein